MKSKILVLVFCLFALNSFSQDEIILHNGSILKAKVTNLNASDGVTIAFIVEGETLTTELSKFAIKDIVFTSGRKQTITEKIIINQSGTKSPDKIIITRNPKEILGLTRIGEVQSKTAFINYRTGANADRKAEDRIKDAAHDMDGVVVLITEDKDYNVGNINKKKLGSAQVRMTGVAYKY
jgi:hypothetical protein